MSSKQQKKKQKLKTKLCPSFDDNEIEKVCVNKDCQGLRVFCVSCWHKGGHSKHGSDVKGISEIDQIIALNQFQEAQIIFDQALKIKQSYKEAQEGKNLCNQKMKKKK